MIKVKEKLTIYHDNNSTFDEYSNQLVDYTRATASFTYIQAEDSIYIGYYKPINVFYVELGTANTNTSVLSVNYWTIEVGAGVQKFLFSLYSGFIIGGEAGLLISPKKSSWKDADGDKVKGVSSARIVGGYFKFTFGGGGFNFKKPK